ncbi:uncharacterized protein CIMG_13619 [Coccidioides immitis RS]|uniref:Uncharacterized protein n=1 Tax=Coccidioides immitis (strain RS) TaxID=246410 RepID=J3K2M3_COCIM|nr:uncharacterized protein CIMG_13619 [Coccidioides immitis RS]EAS28355.3 hypothetical protein CIMG_13619 [Coccidioides immitis RS]
MDSELSFSEIPYEVWDTSIRVARHREAIKFIYDPKMSKNRLCGWNVAFGSVEAAAQVEHVKYCLIDLVVNASAKDEEW